MPSTQGLTKQGPPWPPARAAQRWCSGVLGHCSCTSLLDSSTSVCRDRNEERDPSQQPPGGARPYLVSGMSLWNDFGGIHQSWNLRHGLPVTPVTQGCGAACVCIPPTRGPGARGGSQLTQHSAGCLGPPLNGRELVFPRHLLSNVLSSWATLTQRLRSFLVTSDCVFFRGG